MCECYRHLINGILWVSFFQEESHLFLNLPLLTAIRSAPLKVIRSGFCSGSSRAIGLGSVLAV